MFKFFISGDSCVKQLKIENCCDFVAESLDHSLIEATLNQLEEIEISSTNIEFVHSQCLFDLMKQQTNLKSISFSNLDLSTMNPETLACAVNSVEKANLCGAQLTVTQIEHILRMKFMDSSSLVNLDLKENRNMKDVDFSLRMKAIWALKSFEYEVCDISVGPQDIPEELSALQTIYAVFCTIFILLYFRILYMFE